MGGVAGGKAGTGMPGESERRIRRESPPLERSSESSLDPRHPATSERSVGERPGFRKCPAGHPLDRPHLTTPIL